MYQPDQHPDGATGKRTSYQHLLAERVRLGEQRVDMQCHPGPIEDQLAVALGRRCALLDVLLALQPDYARDLAIHVLAAERRRRHHWPDPPEGHAEHPCRNCQRLAAGTGTEAPARAVDGLGVTDQERVAEPSFQDVLVVSRMGGPHMRAPMTLVYEQGLWLGLDVDDRCPQCGCRFGGHELVSPGEPDDPDLFRHGGTVECPDCLHPTSCGTWCL